MYPNNLLIESQLFPLNILNESIDNEYNELHLKLKEGFDNYASIQEILKNIHFLGKVLLILKITYQPEICENKKNKWKKFLEKNGKLLFKSLSLFSEQKNLKSADIKVLFKSFSFLSGAFSILNEYDTIVWPIQISDIEGIIFDKKKLINVQPYDIKTLKEEVKKFKKKLTQMQFLEVEKELENKLIDLDVSHDFYQVLESLSLFIEIDQKILKDILEKNQKKTNQTKPTNQTTEMNRTEKENYIRSKLPILEESQIDNMMKISNAEKKKDEKKNLFQKKNLN